MFPSKERELAKVASENTGRNGYQTVRLIGHGGMGTVYEAVCLKTGRTCALKVFSVPPGKSQEILKAKFLAEAKIMSSLGHPGIVHVFDSGAREDGGLYLAMDLIGVPAALAEAARNDPAALLDPPPPEAGPAGIQPLTLADLLAAPRPVPEAFIRRFYEDLRSALAYCHAKGIVHSDIKAENVLINKEGRALLTDFGIARVLNPETRKSLNLLSATLPGGAGTPYYLAPECARGESARPASDVYSFGVLLFKLVTGIWYEGSLRLLDEADTLAPDWAPLFRRMLAANPAKRIASAAELPKAPPTGKPRGRLPIIALAAAAILAAVLLAEGWKVRHRPAPATVEPSPATPQPAAKVGPANFSLPSLIEVPLTNDLAFRLRRIPAGSFLMTNRGMPHRVRITRDFYLTETEVTEAQWSALLTNAPSGFPSRELPAVNISSEEWAGAFRRLSRFAASVRLPKDYGFRLPTEAEWRYACLAGNLDSKTVGNGLGRLAWFAGNSGGRLHPVARKQPNAFGLYDMLGNARELVMDLFTEPELNLLAILQEDGVRDPLMVSGDYLLFCGGSARDPATNVTETASHAVWLEYRNFARIPDGGFRLALGPDVFGEEISSRQRVANLPGTGSVSQTYTGTNFPWRIDIADGQNATVSFESAEPILLPGFSLHGRSTLNIRRQPGTTCRVPHLYSNPTSSITFSGQADFIPRNGAGIWGKLYLRDGARLLLNQEHLSNPPDAIVGANSSLELGSPATNSIRRLLHYLTIEKNGRATFKAGAPETLGPYESWQLEDGARLTVDCPLFLADHRVQVLNGTARVDLNQDATLFRNWSFNIAANAILDLSVARLKTGGTDGNPEPIILNGPGRLNLTASLETGNRLTARNPVEIQSGTLSLSGRWDQEAATNQPAGDWTLAKNATLTGTNTLSFANAATLHVYGTLAGHLIVNRATLHPGAFIRPEGPIFIANLTLPASSGGTVSLIQTVDRPGTLLSCRTIIGNLDSIKVTLLKGYSMRNGMKVIRIVKDGPSEN